MGELAQMEYDEAELEMEQEDDKQPDMSSEDEVDIPSEDEVDTQPDSYDGDNYNYTVPEGYENGDEGPHGPEEEEPDDDATPKAPIGEELPVTQEESSDE